MTPASPTLTAADLHALDTAATGIDASRWELAELAAAWKARKVPAWAERIARHDSVRRATRTVYEWAAVAEFRNDLGVRHALPFSFYALARRYVDKLAGDVIADAMQDFEAEASATLEAFGAHLGSLAAPDADPSADWLRLVDAAVTAVTALVDAAHARGELEADARLAVDVVRDLAEKARGRVEEAPNGT